MEQVADEYRRLVETCSMIDYADDSSVERNNRAVDRMYEIVRLVRREDADSVDRLLPLLDEPACARWLAHQLVETGPFTGGGAGEVFPHHHKDLSHGPSAEAMGERMWLKQWQKARKGW